MYGTHELRFPRVAVERWRVQTGLASAKKEAEREGEQMMDENGRVGRAHGTPLGRKIFNTVAHLGAICAARSRGAGGTAEGGWSGNKWLFDPS